MSFAVSATTSSGVINVHSGSVAEIRAAIAEARKEGAPAVSLTENGKTIDESALNTLASLSSTLTRYA